MKSLAIALTLLPLVLSAGCAKDGSDGAPGAPGPQGPLGPGAAPLVAAVFPTMASPASMLRITGSGFDPVPAANVVTIDGVALEVLSTTPAEILVTGAPAVDAAVAAELVVTIGGRPSNGTTVTLAPAGTERDVVVGGLRDPRALALDLDGETVVVFDRLGGILRLNDWGVIEVIHPISASITGPTAGAVVADGLLVGDGARILHVADDGAVTVRASGLPAAPRAFALDAGGALYWVDGTSAIGKLAADGTVTHPFATVPSLAESIARVGADLYVSDPQQGAVDRIAISGGTVTADFAVEPGVHGLATNGVDLIAFVPDVSGASAVRITTAGVKSNAAAPHSILGDASSCGLVVGSTIWAANVADHGIERYVGGAWQLRAATPSRDAADASWSGSHLYFVADNRCVNGTDGGAVFESLGGGQSQLVLENVCARGMIEQVTGAVLVADARDGKVSRLDDTGALTIPVAAGANGASALAAAADGSFFLAIDAGTSWTVAHHDPTGALLDADVFDGALTGRVAGMTVGEAELFVALANRIHVVPLDAAGAPGTPEEIVPQGLGFTQIASLGSDGDGNAVIVDQGDLLRVRPWGAVSFFGFEADASVVRSTPYGELLVLHSFSAPIARLQ